jgi:hypothetical protein
MAEIAARPARAIRRRRRSRAATFALLASLALMAAGVALFARAYTVRDAVLPGVSVAGVDIGGLSRAEAQAKLQAELGPRLAEPVRVAVGEGVLVIRPSEAFSLDAAATAERAYQAGRDSLLSRFGALVAPFAFTQEAEPVLEPLPGERLAARDRLLELTKRPENARLRMDGKEVVVKPGLPGTAVEVDPLLASVRAAALAGTHRVSASVEGRRPGRADARIGAGRRPAAAKAGRGPLAGGARGARPLRARRRHLRARAPGRRPAGGAPADGEANAARAGRRDLPDRRQARARRALEARDDAGRR